MRKTSLVIATAVALVGALAATGHAATLASSTTSAKPSAVKAATVATDPNQLPFKGVFKRTPSHGVAGTVIKLSSVTPCRKIDKRPAEHVNVSLINPRLVSSPTANSVIAIIDAPVAPSGSWKASLKVPTGTPATHYRLEVTCLGAEDDVQFANYVPQGFTVIKHK